jgi:hypothetical protein
VPISIPESLVVALPPILSPSSRTFVELTLVNWRRPWGSRRLDFVIRAGSFNFFIDKISKFCGYQQQQPDRIQIIIDFIVGRFSSAKKEQVPRSAIDYKEKREVYLGLEEAGTYMEMYV